MLEDKLAMIECHAKGEKVVAIDWSFGMSWTTAWTSVHNKGKILACIKSAIKKEAKSLKKWNVFFLFGFPYYMDDGSFKSMAYCCGFLKIGSSIILS